MATIPQRPHDLNINYYEQPSHDGIWAFVIAAIIIVVVILVISFFGGSTCRAGFASSPSDQYPYIDKSGSNFRKSTVWSGLSGVAESIETRFKIGSVPELDAPASMTAIRHLSEHDYGKTY